MCHLAQMCHPSQTETEVEMATTTAADSVLYGCEWGRERTWVGGWVEIGTGGRTGNIFKSRKIGQSKNK